LRSLFAKRCVLLCVTLVLWQTLLALEVMPELAVYLALGSGPLAGGIALLTFLSLLSGIFFAWLPTEATAHSALLVLLLCCAWRGRLTLFDEPKRGALPDGLSDAARWCGRAAVLLGLLYAASAAFEQYNPRQVLPQAAGCVVFGLALWRVPVRRRALDRGAVTLGVVVSLLCLGMLEAASRVIMPQPQVPPDLYRHHPKSLYALTPSLEMTMGFGSTEIADAPEIPIRINRLGMRNEEVPEEKPGDELRVVCIGDSYTFGWGGLEENTFAAQLQVLLRDAVPGRRVRVINAGVGAYGPWQERVVLQERVLPLRPDVVVLQTFCANDIAETLFKEGRVLESYEPEWLGFLSTYRMAGTMAFKVNRWLRLTSNLYFVLERQVMGDWVIVSYYKRFRWKPDLGLPRPKTLAGRLWIAEPDLADWYPALEEGFAEMRRDIEGIQQDCRAAGVPLLAFNIPWFQGMMHRVPPVITLQQELYAPGKGARKLEALLAEVADHSLPLLDRFLSDADPTRFSYEKDGHFVREANTEIAALLAERLLPLLRGSAEARP
jgi:hypothetical protein